MRRLVPLVVGRRVVALGTYAQVAELVGRLQTRRIPARMAELCDGCGRRRASVPVTCEEGDRALCSRCYRLAVAGVKLDIDYETEAERRGGAEPE